MKIHTTGIYHIYNRGNNQQPIFFKEENYNYFLHKCHKYLKPISEILAWCLMSNHFHFLIEVNDKSLSPIKSGLITMPAITNAFRLLQSSYAKGINKQQETTGNLFQQKTKAKLVSSEEGDYSLYAFYYIHQNPVTANIVSTAAQWNYSSYVDYIGLRNGSLCNKNRANTLLNLSAYDLKGATEKTVEEDKIKKIFI